jgi:DNA-binding transcriptional MerR regulator
MTAAVNGSGEDAARPYLAAGGVGVRVKSFKQPSPPAAAPEFSSEMPSRPIVKVINGNLFGASEPEAVADAMPEVYLVKESQLTPPVEPIRVKDIKEEPEAVPDPAGHPMEIEVMPQVATEEPQPVEPQAPTTVTTPAAAAIPTATTTPVAAITVAGTTPIAAITAAAATTPATATTPTAATTAIASTTEEPVEAPLETASRPRRRTSPGRTTATKPPSKRGRKSLKEVTAEAQLIEIPTDEVLFSKQYYTMGEVSVMFRVNQSLLRFWETEFDILQPKKNKKGDRYFRPIDIKNLHLIYHLLRQKKYTIEGAKEFLKKNKKADDRFEVIQRLKEIKAFLVELKAQL